MSDLDPMMERELTIQLRPVAAPACLWDGIERGRRAARVFPSTDRGVAFGPAGWLAWSAAAVTLLTLSVGFVLRAGRARDPLAGIVRLTSQELRGLTDGSEAIDFRSDDPEQVRAWVKQRADIDIALPEVRSAKPGARIVGVRVIQSSGVPVAVVAYRVNGTTAALLVSKNRTPLAATRHGSSYGRSFAWNTASELYAVALSGTEDPRGACILCHAAGVF